MASLWVYLLGSESGEDIKIGHSSKNTVGERLNSVNDSQMTRERYHLLAAVLGSRKDETKLHRHFSHLRREDKGNRQEYFWADAELVEYAAWLRSQWFAAVDEEMSKEDAASTLQSDDWMPGPHRRMPKPISDPTKMIQDWETLPSVLSGTPWSWFPNPKASIQDYFTPPEILNAAREGMGGLDLDAASHWLANRTHKVPRYFHAGYSAFEHEWERRVWLNPPYGENPVWWERVLEQIEKGNVEQICILSPVWAFTTAAARPLMAISSAMILLQPTPKFWGNSENRTGVNHPHAIVYIGHRRGEVLESLSPFGIPMLFDNEVFAGVDCAPA